MTIWFELQRVLQACTRHTVECFCSQPAVGAMKQQAPGRQKVLKQYPTLRPRKSSPECPSVASGGAALSSGTTNRLGGLKGGIVFAAAYCCSATCSPCDRDLCYKDLFSYQSVSDASCLAAQAAVARPGVSARMRHRQ